jgi:hypothetical protein
MVMNRARTRYLIIWVAAGIVFDLLLLENRSVRVHLGDPRELTGYWLRGAMIFLALFNLRKRLPMLPLGNAATWLALHAVGGVLVGALFLLHTGNLWPSGAYEKALAVLSYLTVLSGIAGYFIQRIYPRLLTETGIEVIYERIPLRISELRQKAEALVLECCDQTRFDTLGRHYLDSLQWFFRRPRFTLNHIVGSKHSQEWLRHQDEAVRRYLNDDERKYLDDLSQLARQKDCIDLHYTLQGAMKRWLLVHIPLTVALMVLSFWHLLVVNVYSL